MRETRLFDYATPGEVIEFATGDVVISARDVQRVRQPQGQWAGLLNVITAWRVEEGRILVIENASMRKGLRLGFSARISCHPLLRVACADGITTVEILVSCFSGSSGCTLIQIRVSMPRSDPSIGISYDEVARQMLPKTTITCMAEVDDDVVVGCTDGSISLVRFATGSSERITIAPFSYNSVVSHSSRNQGENTSMVSGASNESNTSHRSVASSMSRGFMTRLFGGSPHGGAGTPGQTNEGTSQELGGFANLSRRHVNSSSQSKNNDKVLDVALVKLDCKAMMSLHASGRICVYVFKEGMYHFVTDITLPVKLSLGKVDHFLLTGSAESTIAVVMVDEDPRADSLRLFNVTAKIRQERNAGVSFTQIAKRDGPIDRIMSASFTGEDVIVASESGFISGILNVPNDPEQSSGIPCRTLWTAFDDLDQPLGMGRILDEVMPNPKDQLQHAHRFSCSAVAKALRLDNPTFATRSDIATAIKDAVFEEDESTMWNRLKARTEQFTRSEDLRIRGISCLDGVGIVVARQKSVYVLRALLEPEQRSIENPIHLLRDKNPGKSFEASIMLSSHGICQVLASQFHNEKDNVDSSKKLRFILSMASSFSSLSAGSPITDLISSQEILRRKEGTDDLYSFRSAIELTRSILEPGGDLLLFLNSSNEMEMLRSAAEQCADSFPISSMYASGIAWLSQYRQQVRLATVKPEVLHDCLEGVEKEDASTALGKAYRSLISATKLCVGPVLDLDVSCAISLAGLCQDPLDERSENRDDIIMDGAVGKIRNDLGFWLLERSVRLLESSGSPSNAAAAALEAMMLAPDRKRHEMMRAAAFGRFLDAGELQQALTAIVSIPYREGAESNCSAEESGALRDAIDLFVNAAADRNLLRWLSNSRLPEPLHVLCGMALERRARASDVIHVQQLLGPQHQLNVQTLQNESMSLTDSGRPICEYEQLYSWHILRGDTSCAATAALEWGERLCREGLSAVRAAIVNQSDPVVLGRQIKLLLAWAKSKSDAYTYVSTAAHLQVRERRYVVRSRFSLLADERQKMSGIVTPSWISRRHLLAHAQGRCFTAMLSEADTDNTTGQRIQYLLAHDSLLLGEQSEGVRWAIVSLLRCPTYDSVLLCAELGSAWREEIGDFSLLELVRNAAGLTSQKAVTSFGYSELDKLLLAISSAERAGEPSRNWSLIALESALSTTAGAFTCPQWLIDAAAWGTPAFAEGMASSGRSFAGNRKGDAAGVVRVLLRNHRPVDAAKLLLVGLAGQAKQHGIDKLGKQFYVPYSAIDATMEMLAELEEEYEEAEVYKKLLAKETDAHTSRMEQLGQKRFLSVDMET